MAIFNQGLDVVLILCYVSQRSVLHVYSVLISQYILGCYGFKQPHEPLAQGAMSFSISTFSNACHGSILPTPNPPPRARLAAPIPAPLAAVATRYSFPNATTSMRTSSTSFPRSHVFIAVYGWLHGNSCGGSGAMTSVNSSSRSQGARRASPVILIYASFNAQ